MLNIIPLFSGSSGNSVYLESNTTSLLIDAGVSAKKITKALEFIGKDIAKVSYIVISHEHKDHISGLKTLLKKNPNIKVCATEKTMQLLDIEENNQKIYFKPNHHFILSDITVFPFNISHDAVEPCGFTFVKGNHKISCMTDVGCITKDIIKNLSGSDIVYIEANHEIDMVKCCSYPFHLKRRILGDEGHLSNDISGQVISLLAKEGTKKFVLGHLSEENNTPDIAINSIIYSLIQNNITLDDISISIAAKGIV